MTEPTPPSDTGGDGTEDAGRGSSAGLALWQKLVAIIGLVVVVVLVILLLVGDHGPGRHAPSSRQTQTTDVDDGAAHEPGRWSHA
jgi:hypothetical protein